MKWLLQTDHATLSAHTVSFLTTYGALPNLYNNNNNNTVREYFLNVTIQATQSPAHIAVNI